MLFATGLMTRRHMSLEECLSHISKVRTEFCDTLIRPVHFTSANLPLIHEDRVKEIARTPTNLRLSSTRGSDDPRHRPIFSHLLRAGSSRRRGHEVRRNPHSGSVAPSALFLTHRPIPALRPGLLSVGLSGLNCFKVR